MNHHIPDNFVEVSKATFDWLLESVNWTRDGWCNGEVYTAKGWDSPDVRTYADGFKETVLLPRVVAMREIELERRERWLIDPEFFRRTL